jgi:2-polyprenyl-3-methyl-5-hydroxy-6-metoxy-1,4-benzoquinol methylase
MFPPLRIEPPRTVRRASGELYSERTRRRPMTSEGATSAPRPCLICFGIETDTVFVEHGIDIHQCRACGHVSSSYEAEVHYDGYWGEEVPEDHEHAAFYWAEAHGPMYEAFFRRFISGYRGRLLDVGCGLGYFVKAMAEFGSWEAHGIEISQAAVRYATEGLGLQNVRSGLVQEAGYPDDHFDVVTLWDVIEHLREPDPLLAECRRVLRPEGLLFMHTPNVGVQLPKARLKALLKGMRAGVHYLEARDHLHLYSPDTLTRLATRNGFKEIEFLHLPPIQSVAGSGNPLLRGAKNLWFHTSRALAVLSRGRCNLDNLFAACR